MKIQSISVVVPTQKCINNCKFCCARMVKEDYKNQMDSNLPFYDLYLKDYLERLAFARDNGCNTIMLTGNGEPQQNRQFLMMFGLFNKMLDNPFKNIEMQTTGVLLDENYLRFLRNHVGVKTISISISSFDSNENCEIIGVQPQHAFDLKDLCSKIKKYDFNLRLSINLTDTFNNYTPEEILNKCKEFGADQVTFRKLYTSGLSTDVDEWIKYKKCADDLLDEIRLWLDTLPTMRTLTTGVPVYSYKEMSIVYDKDCMDKEEKDGFKYLILRPDCKLYSSWDNKGSLLF